MPKKLNEDAIRNELHGQSLFFKPQKEAQENEVLSPAPVAPPPPADLEPPKPSTKQTPVRDTTTPRYHDTVIPRHHDTIIETTRRAVKQLGKEAATHRFTVEEKKALKSIERDYDERDIRTSENEITRISINYIIEDYRQHGDDSILARVLKLLNS